MEGCGIGVRSGGEDESSNVTYRESFGFVLSQHTLTCFYDAVDDSTTAVNVQLNDVLAGEGFGTFEDHGHALVQGNF